MPNQKYTFTLNEIITFFENINPNKSASTYTTMKYNLIRIAKMGKVDFIDIDATTIQPKNLEEAMATYSVNSQIQTILGINLWIKYKIVKLNNSSKSKIDAYNTLKNKWDVLLKDLCNQKNKKIEENKMTKTEEENWIDYTDLKKKWCDIAITHIDEYKGSENATLPEKKNSFNEWRDLALVSLFIMIPPTRIGNYEKMRIRYTKTNDVSQLKRDKNYIMIDNDAGIFVNTGKFKYKLCFNQYKTSKHIGQVCENIEDTLLIKVLNIYLDLRLSIQPIQKHRLNDTDSLFINVDTKNSLTQSVITELLKKTTNKFIGKKLSCDMFRKIFLTWFLSDDTKSIADRKKVARFIGQTYNPTIMEKYRKIVEPTEHRTPIVLDFS